MPARGLSRRGNGPASFLLNPHPAKATVNESAKKTVLRQFPYGLYVVTVMSEGEDHGMTANWVMQTAFTPPMVVVAIENESKSLPMMRDARAFAINVLAAGQRDVAARLGKSSRKVPHKLRDVATRPAPVTGAPILSDGLGWIECRFVATMPSGDHTLVLGEVVEAGVEHEGKALTLAETGMKYAG
jgi:flavin reductase (DIM6/NTAB) family NADH-FMN oxidoreductase RutF